MTLIRPQPSVGFHYSRIAREYGVDTDPDRLESAFRTAWKKSVAGRRKTNEPPYGQTMDDARAFWNPLVRICFQEAGYSPPDDPRFYHDLFDRFATAECWALYDDVLPALDLLDDRAIPYGVLTNWDPRVRPTLDDVGILPRFSAVVLSSDVGCEKPGAAIFRAAQLIAGVDDPDGLALIGDDVESDGEGARRAGWRHCLVARPPARPIPEALSYRATLPDAVLSLLAPS
jgi:putative hydrolase of the HAD superfamily